jgi:hypothetical protein
LPLIHRPFINGLPIVTVYIGVSTPRRSALTAAGLAIPNFVPMQLLIDTGASCVVLDQTAIGPLNLDPTGVATMHTPSTAASTPHQTNQYDVSLIMTATGEGAPLTIEALPILEGAFQHQGIDGLLGRDVLARCTLIFNAPAGGYTLAF